MAPFVYALAAGASAGVIAFVSVYLLSILITLIPRWRKRRSAKRQAITR